LFSDAQSKPINTSKQDMNLRGDCFSERAREKGQRTTESYGGWTGSKYIVCLCGNVIRKPIILYNKIKEIFP
jgi:hypothetical protein